MPDKTLDELASEAREAIRALRALIDRHRRASRRRLIIITVIYIPVAMLIGTIASVGVVSTCFLGGVNHPKVCSYMPGYNDTNDKNRKLVKEFRKLQLRSVTNEKRIAELEKQINDQ